MAKINTQRRLSAGQQAVATAAGVKPSEIQTLTADADRIEIVPKNKKKGDGIWGYEARLVGVFPDGMGKDGETYIKEELGHLVNEASKCAVEAREKWPSAVLDEGKALVLFFGACVKRYNVFLGSTTKTWQGEIALLEKLTRQLTMVRDDNTFDAE